jgi:hypothetical protein
MLEEHWPRTTRPVKSVQMRTYVYVGIKTTVSDVTKVQYKVDRQSKYLP